MVEATVLTSLWAKTNAGGKPHSLVGHLLDAAAVAELLWDEWLSSPAQRDLDAAAGGRGRDLLRLLAGWHDLGKATPAFQVKAEQAHLPELLEASAAQGLGFQRPLPGKSSVWWHGPAGATIIAEAVDRLGWSGWRWACCVIEGHHGTFGAVRRRPPAGYEKAHGLGTWGEAQQALADLVRERLGISGPSWNLTTPSRGVQLALAGVIVMADWIASSNLFPGLGLVDETMGMARARAGAAWQRLGLTRGWASPRAIDGPATFAGRFGFSPRPLQRITMEALAEVVAPGLVIIEAPMGEGKTEAALAVAELISANNGQSGLVFAMPTQGTTDAMYHRLEPWLRSIDDAVPLTLLHGKAMLNEDWRALVEGVRVSGTHDEFGLPLDEFGPPQRDQPAIRPAPSSWLAGRHRGLLSPVAVATVDQLLWAATRTRFVSMRHAGLWGKVLIIDEVHSYDAYMSVFLHELLRWCGRLRVPVVLMSATLPPSVRRDLAAAWARGAGFSAEVPDVDGYPSVIAFGDQGRGVVRLADPYRSDLAVEVSVLGADDVEATLPIACAVAEEVAEGGCALVILNTVKRAQEVYRGLLDRGVKSMLIHGRLTAAERARRTALALDLLGPGGSRPDQLVIVATQIAEQSFDVDADVLFTDLAPVDLMLQRVGRLHRHANVRPPGLTVPRVVITGLVFDQGLPVWPRAFAADPTTLPDVPDMRRPVRTVYRPLALLAGAAAVSACGQWRIPSQVPELVRDAYAAEWLGPDGWSSLATNGRLHEQAEKDLRAAVAATFRLDKDPDDDWLDKPDATLEKLHAGSSTASDDSQRPLVRDGDESVEVSMIVAGARGLTTLGGTPLGPEGARAASDKIAREVLGDSVRLRWRDDLATLGPLPSWAGLPLLAAMPVVVLNEAGQGMAGTRTVRYDIDLGLLEQ